MKKFLETTFGPAELEILDNVLSGWLAENGFSRDSSEGELAAAVLINLFREGNVTGVALRDAAGRHRALIDLAGAAA